MFLYFKMKQYVIWTITPSWAINVALYFIIINYIEFQAAQNSSSPQYMYRIFYHFKYKSLFITIITMKTVVPWSCVTGATI